jgi:hypothetical protein
MPQGRQVLAFSILWMLSPIAWEGAMSKNPAAVALGRLRAAKGDMAAVARLGGLAARGKGGWKPSLRCACGRYRVDNAIKRNHVCNLLVKISLPNGSKP